jgi:hypothetical protein
LGSGIFFLLFVGFLLVPIGGMTLDVMNNHPPGMVKNLVVFLVVAWLLPGYVIIMFARGLWEDDAKSGCCSGEIGCGSSPVRSRRNCSSTRLRFEYGFPLRR